MEIINKKNKVFFNLDDKAFGNITINFDNIIIELIKVAPEHRNNGLGTYIFTSILNFIKSNFKNIKYIKLTPLPLDSFGLNIDQLIAFYTKYRFKNINYLEKNNPYLMVRYL